MSNYDLLLYDGAYMYAIGKAVGEHDEQRAEYFRSLAILTDIELKIRLGILDGNKDYSIDK